MRWIVEVTASGSSPGTHKKIKLKKNQIVCMFQIEACAPFQKKDLIHPLQIIIITCTASISLVCFEIYYSKELKGHCLISCSSQSWGHGRNAVRNAAIKCPAVSINCWTGVPAFCPPAFCPRPFAPRPLAPRPLAPQAFSPPAFCPRWILPPGLLPPRLSVVKN